VNFGSASVNVGDFNADSCELTLTKDSSLVTNNLNVHDTSLTLVDPAIPTIISKITTTIVSTILTIENKDGSWQGKSFPILSFYAANAKIEFSDVRLISQGSLVTASKKKRLSNLNSSNRRFY